MAQKVKFLQTSAGTYGLALTGDKLVLKNADASHLEKNGVVEILGEAGEDEEVSVAPKGSVRISDQTGQGAAPAGETDEKNPTGPDKPAPKTAPLKSAKKGKR